MKQAFSVVLTGDPLVSDTIRVSRGNEGHAMATTLFEVVGNGGGVLAILASNAGATHETTPVVEGAVGLTYIAEAQEQIYVTAGGAPLTGLSVSAATSAGTLPTSKADSAGSGFLAGVAVGVAIASK